MAKVTELRPNMPPIPVKGVAILVAVLAVLAFAASNVLIVAENEYRVIRNWTGVVHDIKDVAGPTFKLPFLQTDQSLPKHKLLYDGTPRDILTSDQKPIIVDHYAVWSIGNPREFVSNTQSMSKAEQLIDAAVYSTVRGMLGRLQYSDIIAEGAGGRRDLGEQVTSRVNEELTRGGYGITVHDVRLKRTDLPEQNLHAVYNRMQSDRRAIAADYLALGDEEAMKVRAQTDREAAELVAAATRQAKEIIAEGEVEAAKIYNEAYGADPSFYELYRTLESYRTTLSGNPAIVIPIDSPYARLLLGR